MTEKYATLKWVRSGMGGTWWDGTGWDGMERCRVLLRMGGISPRGVDRAGGGGG